jgi:spore coat polysaccharide biosynthesis predicted glycosyltransferase SpsG
MIGRGMFVLHAAGGEQIGVGHLGRCRSLAAELLRKKMGTVFLLYESPEAVAARFAVPGARTLIARSKGDAVGIRRQLLREKRYSYAVLVTDLLNLRAKDAEDARRDGFDILVHINDSGLPAYAADLFVDGDAFKMMSEANVGHSRLLSGAPYHIINPAVAARRPNAPWSKPTVEKVLICFGGADPERQTELFLHRKRNRRLSVTFTAVAGPAFSSERWEALRALTGPYDRLVRAPSEMADLILDHDAIVTLGGLTSYEAMCLGRAVLAVPLSHMAPYVKRLAAAGLLKSLGNGVHAIDELCGSLADVAGICQLAHLGWETIDGRGTERVAAVLARMLREPDF